VVVLGEWRNDAAPLGTSGRIAKSLFILDTGVARYLVSSVYGMDALSAVTFWSTVNSFGSIQPLRGFLSR